MLFSDLATGAVATSLAAIAERSDDLADAFFERREEVELVLEGEAPRIRSWREEGFAIRLARLEQTWLASRDGLDSLQFGEALRQVARALPRRSPPLPQLGVSPWDTPCEAPELEDFSRLLERSVRRHHVAFPMRLAVRRHRRWLRVVGSHLAPDAESEAFYSCAATLAWGRYGTLLPRLGSGAAERVAASLVGLFQARRALPPEATRAAVVLGPTAAAVLVHEAVAHALEADTLALGGDPQRVLGVVMGPEALHVIDDPGSGPDGVRRTTDDEGICVARRWLLKGGVAQQPLADSLWARDSEVLLPGAARRGSRHLPPGPRSTHLELLGGDCSPEQLWAGAEGGLYFPEATRGCLDPHGGSFTLELPFGRRIVGGEPADPVGPCRLQGPVTDLLGAITAIGREVEVAGAGWCAKGGQKMPVWATTPSLRLEGVEVKP